VVTERIRVFCSHNSVDKPRVKAAAGIDPWVDAWEIAPGDDIVARINEGLADCQVGLIFFSKKTLEKPWVRNEVSALTYQAIEDGKAVIPVMLDADAPVPELRRPRARVAGEDLDRLIAAIYGRSGKPRLAPVHTGARERVLRIRLDQLEGGGAPRQRRAGRRGACVRALPPRWRAAALLPGVSRRHAPGPQPRGSP
jgi:hypothetical protein